MKTKTDLNQHFLVDEGIVRKMIAAADIRKTDTVLEIGPGTGKITALLAPAAKKVIAVEIDPQFKSNLEKMPENVSVVFQDVLAYFKKKPSDFNKIVSNIPFNLCEPLLQYIIRAENIDLSVLITSVTFAKKAKVNPVFSSFLKIEELEKVPGKSYDPVPSVDTEIIRVTREEKADSEVERILYEQKDKKLKNALISMLTVNKTKKEAKKEIDEMKIPKNVLDKKVAVLSAEYYKKISRYLLEKEK